LKLTSIIQTVIEEVKPFLQLPSLSNMPIVKGEWKALDGGHGIKYLLASDEQIRQAK
jgi:hypothetical protein